jgi:uncharacterized protein (TIGR00369 family)
VRELQLTRDELQTLFDGQHLGSIDEIGDDGRGPTETAATVQRPWDLTITELSPERVRTHVVFNAAHLRPGGVVAGPVLFSLIDANGWLATVGCLPPGSDAVTVDANVRYLRPTPTGDLVTEAVVLRRGKRQVVTTVTIATAAAPDTPVAHAVITFAPVLDGLAGIRNRVP